MRRSTPEHERLVRDWRNSDPNKLRHAVAMIGKDGLYSLEGELSELLDHSDWSVRDAALYSLLIGMERHGYFPRALEMLRQDREATHSVGMTLSLYVKMHAPERFSEVMEALVTAMLESADPDLQSGHYTALQSLVRVLQPDREVTYPSDFDLARDVDWQLFAKWVPANLTVPEGVLSTREVSSPEDLMVVKDEDASTADRIAAMERLLLDRRQEARGVIEGLYRADDPELVVAALRGYSTTWGTALMPSAGLLLRSSPHEEVRLAAAEALALLDRSLHMGFSAATSRLLGAVRDDVSPRVRRVAYEAVLGAVAPERLIELPDSFDPETDIDWDLLQRILPEGA